MNLENSEELDFDNITEEVEDSLKIETQKKKKKLLYVVFFVLLLVIILNQLAQEGIKDNPGISLPKTDDITYINNPTESNYPENATPCEIDELEFTHITDKRENDPTNHKTYAVTKIGDQCWMAENLAYTGNGCLDKEWKPYHETTNSYPSACNTHSTDWGVEVLYQWGAAMNGDDGLSGEPVQGSCPEGWVIPTDDEITDLERALCTDAGNSDCETTFPYGRGGFRGTDEGERLKSESPNWDGTDSAGFNALPAGLRVTSGPLSGVGSYGSWWSSVRSGSNARRRSMNSGLSDVFRTPAAQASGYSVRCLQETLTAEL